MLLHPAEKAANPVRDQAHTKKTQEEKAQHNQAKH
jgi:hypothetical protein